MSDRVLHVENLTVDIPLATGILHAVDSVSLHVDRGETLCIVGESGCGKSLTSLALMDLLPTKAIRKIDKLELGGQSILGYSEREMSDVRGNKMGMILFQRNQYKKLQTQLGKRKIKTAAPRSFQAGPRTGLPRL